MKKFKNYFASIVFSAFAVAALLAVSPMQTKAAEDEVTVSIDGVVYTLEDSDSGIYGEARLDEISTQTEVYVRNEVEYQGEYYPIATFEWDDDEFVSRERGYSDGWEDLDMNKYIPVHQTLRKVTIAPDVDVVGHAINFPNLEEVSFEGKISYPYGIYYYNCPKLKNVHIPADYRMSENKRSVVDVKRCPSVTITVDERNPYFRVIDNDVYSKDGKILYNVTNNVKNYKVRNGVTKIEEYALNGNNQTESVYIPNSVKKIGDHAMGCMANLRSVRMSKSVTKLSAGVFKHSRKLKKLDLPKKMRTFAGEFGGNAFNKFKKITIRAKSLKKGNFGSLSSKCKVYVRNGKVRNQLRQYGFKGKIFVKAKLK